MEPITVYVVDLPLFPDNKIKVRFTAPNMSQAINGIYTMYAEGISEDLQITPRLSCAVFVKERHGDVYLYRKTLEIKNELRYLPAKRPGESATNEMVHIPTPNYHWQTSDNAEWYVRLTDYEAYTYHGPFSERVQRMPYDYDPKNLQDAIDCARGYGKEIAKNL